MPSLPVLLRRHADLVRRQIEVENEIADVQREIVDASNAPRTHGGRHRSTKAEVVETVRAVMKVLRDAGEALPRREIASRLGISPHAAAYRLRLAMQAKYVESVGAGRYRVTNVVPAAF